MVSHADATAYGAWLSAKTGQTWRLPSELEWEKAARGVHGTHFPWGDKFDSARLNSHDSGPFDTLAVGQFPAGASPFSLLDAAGQVFEWTNSPGNPGRFLVKGGSWDDKGCGVCRPAARHARPEAIKHILICFRLVLRKGENYLLRHGNIPMTCRVAYLTTILLWNSAAPLPKLMRPGNCASRF